MEEVIAKIEKLKLLPMIKIDDAKNALPLAEALAEGGLPCAEVTFRTDAAEEAIKKIAAMGNILLGAGTVLNAEQAAKAIDGGCEFVVTPGFAPEVVKYCLHKGVAVFPGTSTPTDLQAALDMGLSVVKFFPATASGGVPMLKAISAPYHMMRFIPTGGIKADNLREFLDFPKVIACGGSWLAKDDIVNAGNFAEITRLAREAAEIAGSEA
jgi:2-dehydro-3-deoxyphosphogluconate aldolase/(4S)-4-hydroxy-2-oxoglutarate aldolase